MPPAGLPRVCFDALRAHHDPTHRPAAPPLPADPYPLFVTWNIVRRGREELRGCIGTFTAVPLDSGVAKYALKSALDDHRFDPIPASEIPHLTCGVSLLTDFEQARDALDWEIGTHGIWIDFSVDGRAFNATYLPEVCPAQGWSKREALASLVKKAGHRGPLTDALLAAISLRRYQSHKSHMTYDDYLRACAS